MARDNPQVAWRRFLEGTGPLHDLTVTVAKALHEFDHMSTWEHVAEHDQWLAVGTWQRAETVVASLPMVVAPCG